MIRLRRLPSFAALVLTAGVVVAGCGNDDPGSTVEASPTVANVGNLPDTSGAVASGAAAAAPAVVELPGGTLPPGDTEAPDTAAATEPVAETEGAEPTAAGSSVESSVPVTAVVVDPCAVEGSVPASTVSESTVPESTVPESSVPESTSTESTLTEPTLPESTLPESSAPDCAPATTDTGASATEVSTPGTEAAGTDVSGSAASEAATDETATDETGGSDAARPNALASARDRWEAFAADADPETFAGGADTADLVDDNRVLMIGDSIMASTSSRYGGEACRQLEPAGWAVEVNAETGRFIDFGMRVLDDRLDAGFDVAVVMLGNNYGANPDVFEDGLRDIVDELIDSDPGMPIILYTVTMYRPDRAEVNDIVYEVAAEHDNIRVIDWETETSEDPSLVGGDGLHLSDSGRARMIELLAEELGDAPDGSTGDCLGSDFTDDSATSGTGTTLPGQAPYTNPPQWTNPPQNTRPQPTNPPQTQAPQPTEPQPEPTNPPATNPPATNPPPTNPPQTNPPPTNPTDPPPPPPPPPDEGGDG
ncbi:GDSL-type esterase/lipase family protein [Desertimonas flava]|uniref:GDSL-type esterase/lipase family protein n=1 Tax=Desertimonas flava TaxID=2064846 RepID=UPI0023F4EF34|nr:GDSL-type esterase/lipase family protein [Desertimonas flava]